MSDEDRAMAAAVQTAVGELFPGAEVNRYTPDGTHDHGFAVLLRDGERRHFNLVVSMEWWDDHSAEELAEKLAEAAVQERLGDSSYRRYTLTNEAGLVAHAIRL